MSKRAYAVFVCLFACWMFKASASESGVFLGTDLYDACKVAKENIQESTELEKSPLNMAKIATCYAWIYATYAMAVFETNLIQNKALKEINRPNLVATKDFFAANNFCVPSKLTNDQLILIVVEYMESQNKAYENAEGNDKLLYTIKIPATDVILRSFHKSLPCEL